MEELIVKIEKFKGIGAWLDSYIDRVLRTTSLYFNGDLPHQAWKHLMIQSLMYSNRAGSQNEQINKLEVDQLIDAMIQTQEPKIS